MTIATTAILVSVELKSMEGGAPTSTSHNVAPQKMFVGRTLRPVVHLALSATTVLVKI